MISQVASKAAGLEATIESLSLRARAPMTTHHYINHAETFSEECCESDMLLVDQVRLTELKGFYIKMAFTSGHRLVSGR